MKLKKRLPALAMLALLSFGMIPDALAHHRYRGHDSRYYGYSRYSRYTPTFGQRHPYVKKAAIGGGAGALVGGLLAPEGSRTDGAVKGAMVGAAVGLGYEYLRRDNRRW